MAASCALQLALVGAVFLIVVIIVVAATKALVVARRTALAVPLPAARFLRSPLAPLPPSSLAGAVDVRGKRTQPAVRYRADTTSQHHRRCGFSVHRHSHAAAKFAAEPLPPLPLLPGRRGGLRRGRGQGGGNVGESFVTGGPIMQGGRQDRRYRSLLLHGGMADSVVSAVARPAAPWDTARGHSWVRLASDRRGAMARLSPLKRHLALTGCGATTPLASGEDDKALAREDDTVFALSSSGASVAGVAVIRISGPDAHAALMELCSGCGSRSAPPRPKHRMASVRRVYDPSTGDLLDECLVLCFDAPRSFTGQDTVELHTHGSRAVVTGVLAALADLPRVTGGRLAVRAAERGEFTRRAYACGRLGLTEVEGLSDLLKADTAAERRQALRQMGGATERAFGGWRKDLAGCLAHCEAVIDFGDADEEGDVDEAAYDNLAPTVAVLRDQIATHLADARRGEIVRGGVRVAIVGPPNAGKSTLLNALAKRDAAIVSNRPGTTRDVVEVKLDLGGAPVVVSDTAGVRRGDGVDEIEREGVKRAMRAAADAHLIVFVFDAADPGPAGAVADEITALFKAEAASGETVLPSEARAQVLVVANKCDKVPDERKRHDSARGLASRLGVGNVDGEEPFFQASLGAGTEDDGARKLLAELERRAAELCGSGIEGPEPALLTRQRHRVHAEACLDALDGFVRAQHAGMPLDVAAEELRVAARELGRVVGAIDVEEVLDALFKDFCIGK